MPYSHLFHSAGGVQHIRVVVRNGVTRVIATETSFAVRDGEAVDIAIDQVGGNADVAMRLRIDEVPR